MIINNTEMVYFQDMIKVYWVILTQILIFLNNLNHTMTSGYYYEISFNNTFSDNQCLSLLHLNIRSIPLHFTEFVSYLDTLNVHFKIIALSETAINSQYAIYIMPNYSI